MAKVFLNKQYSNYLGENRSILDIVTSFTTGDTPTPPVFEFCIGNGFDDYTYAVVEDYNNNKLMVVGSFNYYKNYYSPCIVRLDKTTGDVDTTFSSPYQTPQTLVNVTPSNYFPGKYYVCGLATILNRLNSDGSIDNSFSPSSLNGQIQKCVELSDGSIIVIGTFSSPRNRIVKFNSDGSLNTTFQVGAGFNSTSTDILLSQDGNDIFVCGNMTLYSGITVGRLVKINSTTGVLNNTFGSGLTVFNNRVHGICFDSNQNIWSIGYFTGYPHESGNANYIAAVDSTDGSTVSGVDFGTGYTNFTAGIKYDSFNNRVVVLNEQTTPNFSTYNGTTFYGKISALDCTDGSLVTTFGSLSDTNYGFKNDYFAESIYPDESLVDSQGDSYIVGRFSSFSGDRYERIIKLDDTGQSITRTNC